jgi:hypothetical protein
LNFEELVKRLIADGKGDTARLEHILSTVQRGVSLYTSDQEYVEKLLEEIKKSENPQPTEEPIKIETKVESTQQPEKQLTEIEELRKEIHKLQDQNHTIEKHLKNQWGQKMRKANAVGGVVLMAIGIMMVVGGGASVLDQFCIGQSTGYGGTCRSDMMGFIAGAVVFWIGMIPTIFGVRLIAKA